MAVNNRKRSRESSVKIAFCGLTAALSVALMLAGGLIPIATYCVPMAAGVLLLPVMIEFGKKTAWTTFAAAALICILLGIDKEAAFFYVFLGHYPIVKWEIDRIKNKRFRVLTKLTLWSGAIIAMYLFLGLLMNMGSIVAEFGEMGALFTVLLLILFDICMLLFDRLLMPLVFLYAQRIRPRIRFLMK